MTVVVAFVTEDAAVMASDTEGTEGDNTRRESSKIWPCGGVLFGYSGTSSVKQPLVAGIEGLLDGAANDTTHEPWQFRAQFCAMSRGVIDTAYANHVPRPAPGEIPKALAGLLLAIGRAPSGAFWLLEVDYRNSPTFYTDAGFHAVGSGSVAAQVAQGLMKGYERVGRSLPHLRLRAYRTVATSIDVLGGQFGVGGKVRIWQSADSGFESLTDTQLTAVENGVAQWVTIEAESLDRVVLDEREPEGVAMPEALPEPGGDGPAAP